MKNFFTCIIFVINFIFIIFPEILLISIILNIFFAAILFVRIVFILIITVGIPCFYIINWYQIKIGWIKFVFNWLAKFLTADRCIFLKSSLFYIHFVVIIFFSCDMNLDWTIFGRIVGKRNTLQLISIFFFVICECYLSYQCTSGSNEF